MTQDLLRSHETLIASISLDGWMVISLATKKIYGRLSSNAIDCIKK